MKLSRLEPACSPIDAVWHGGFGQNGFPVVKPQVRLGVVGKGAGKQVEDDVVAAPIPAGQLLNFALKVPDEMLDTVPVPVDGVEGQDEQAGLAGVRRVQGTPPDGLQQLQVVGADGGPFLAHSGVLGGIDVHLKRAAPAQTVWKKGET